MITWGGGVRGSQRSKVKGLDPAFWGSDPRVRVFLPGPAADGGRSRPGAERGRSRLDHRSEQPRPDLRAAAAHQRHHVDGPGGTTWED